MGKRSPQSLGRYLLDRRIGAGGMGEVWVARCEGMDGPVVIKRLHRSLTDDRASVDRFFDELVNTQRLAHENIVRVFDGGRIGDTWFLAMEFIDGLHLRECLRANGGPLQPALAASLVRQAAVGLAFAHAAVDADLNPMNLVHRDISPDNLMVDKTGTVKVLDFGIARSKLSLTTTRISVRQGKLRYMAPEYLDGGKATPGSDVYALGMTLFELCTGMLPFEGTVDPVALVEALTTLGLPPADEVRPDVPAQLSAIISSATEIDPVLRTPSMNELVGRLDHFLKRHPAPDRAALCRLVAFWQERHADPKSEKGSLGQLELTAAAPASWEAKDLAREPTTSPHVQVAHPLDLTLAVSLADAIAGQTAETTAPVTAPVTPALGEHTVIVSPELKGVSQVRARKKRRKPRQK